MRLLATIAASSMLLAGCEGRQQPAAPVPGNESAVPAAVGEAAAAGEAGGPARAAGWDLHSDRDGATLALAAGGGRIAIRLVCPAGQKRLLVNVPGLRPIGSEERLSLGAGGEVVALVADVRGDSKRGGVTATGELPKALKAIVEGPVTASYGNQTSGPYDGPPKALSDAFVAACGGGATASVSPCLLQDGERLRTSLRAVGTEPFWGARVEGRCVTYSHPEDQQGTRVWTRFAPGPGGGTWSGTLGGQRFELRVRSQPGCSDGMSDRSYPLSAELLVGGERRQGCAEPLPAS